MQAAFENKAQSGFSTSAPAANDGEVIAEGFSEGLDSMMGLASPHRHASDLALPAASVLGQGGGAARLS